MPEAVIPDESPPLAPLLTRAIRLLEQELTGIAPGERGDLVRVLTELRHQVAALAALQKAQRSHATLEAAVIGAIQRTDARLWLQVAAALDDLAAGALPEKP